MPVIIDGTNGITQAGEFNSDSSFGFKNRIINGAMVISQRNGTSSVTPINGQYVLDRFQYNHNQASKFTTQQSTTAPVGFVNSLLVTSSSAYSLGAGDYFAITQPIEGYNVADLGWGTANAKTVTLSAWVYSSLTGTFGGSIMNGAYNYAYPFTYSIPVANTWTQISVTIAGPTAGTWPTDNSSSVQVIFGLGVGTTYSGTAGAWTGSLKFSATGAVSVVSTNGATFYITGVQLEVGSTATSFDYRSIGTELALCQRYFEAGSLWREGTNAASGNFCVFSESFLVQKRTDATFTYGNVGGANAGVASVSGPEAIYEWITPFAQTNARTGFAFRLVTNNNTSTIRQYWLASAEL